MRILQVIPVFSARFGGPVRVVRSISKELAKRHEVTVYTTSALDHKRDFKNSPVEVKLNGYRVVYFPRTFRFSGFNVSLTMARALHETLSEYDVIHLHSWRHFQDMIIHYYAKKYVVPYISQARGSLPRIMAKQRLKWIYDVSFGYKLLRDASKVVALTQMEAQQYEDTGVPKEKIEVIPNGIDVSEFKDLPRRGAFRRTCGIDEGEKLILYLGRIHKIKGIDLLIETYANLLKKLGDVRLVIVGPDDGYLSICRKLVKHLRIEEKALFMGPLYGRDKLEAYVDADVYALPSRYEMFPNTILEACACGTPVVTTENCGIADFVRDNVGLVVKATVTELRDALLKILQSEELRDKFRSNCIESVTSEFEIGMVVSKLETLYMNVVNDFDRRLGN